MDNEKGKPWYSCSGNEQDVIISSRVRLARNLANFPFPMHFRNDDSNRVQTLLFDSFAQVQQQDETMLFHAINTNELDPDGHLLLEERGIVKPFNPKREVLKETGVVMSLDGRCGATINYGDHLRLSSFKAGLSVRDCFDAVCDIDKKLQKSLQFAASYDFGYLTAALRDTGSGMKITARLHLPATIQTGHLNDVVAYLETYNFKITPAFPDISQGSAAGAFYQVSTTSAMKGSELDQLAEFEAACKFIAESERKISRTYADNKRTIIRNSLLRAVSIAKCSLLVSYKEAVSLISDIKFGLDRGFLTGIEDSQLCGLLYRIQRGHLSYLLQDGKFEFEPDIAQDKRSMIDRLRALILQEAFEKISLGNL